MISLKRLINDGQQDESVETLERVVQLLLQAFALHSIAGAPEDYAAFQGSINEIYNSVKTVKDAKDYLVLGGAAIRSIEDYQRRTVRYLSRLRAEMQRMIGMLTTSISTISETSQENLHRLREIEDQVAKAAELDDVQQVKTKLSECLEDIRKERDRQKAQASTAVANLSEALEASRSEVDSPATSPEAGPRRSAAEADPITRLPGRGAAEAAIERQCGLHDPFNVVVIILDNLSSINVRYGRGVGDEVLQAYADYIAQLLPPEHELFRWDGPALVTLSRCSEKPERTRETFAKILVRKFEHSIHTSSRDSILSVTNRWTVLQLGPVPEAVFQKIDRFVSPANVAPAARG